MRCPRCGLRIDDLDAHTAYMAYMGVATHMEPRERMITMTETRPLHEIAREITRDWSKPYFGAVPYLQAMRTLESTQDNYGMDSGKEIVLYFLSNANTWKGETARRVKAELRKMVGLK